MPRYDAVLSKKIRAIEEVITIEGFEKVVLERFDEDKNTIIFYLDRYSWLLAVPRSEYESWGSPETITGKEIMNYRSRLQR